MNKLFLVLIIFFSSISISSASTVDINVAQVGDDVVFTGSGSIDLSGLGNSSVSNLSVTRSQFNLFGGADTNIDVFDITIPTFVPLNDGFFSFDSVSGDEFFVQGLNGGNRDQGFFGITLNYTSDDPLSFIWIVNNQILADLDLNFGIVAEFGNNTVNLIESVAPVPVPAALPLFFSAIAGLSIFSKKRGFKA